MNPYQPALSIFWSVYILSLAQFNKSLLEEGTLQLSGKGLANGNIKKTLCGPLDPGTAVPPAQSSAPPAQLGARSSTGSLLLSAGTASPSSTSGRTVVMG